MFFYSFSPGQALSWVDEHRRQDYYLCFFRARRMCDFFRKSDWKLQPGMIDQSEGRGREKTGGTGGREGGGSVDVRMGSLLVGMMMGTLPREGAGLVEGDCEDGVWSLLLWMCMGQCSLLSIEQRSNKRNKIYLQPRNSVSRLTPTQKDACNRQSISAEIPIKSPHFPVWYSLQLMFLQAIFLGLLSLSLGQQTKVQFQIRKRQASSSASVPVGKLLVRIYQQQRTIQAQVEPYLEQFLLPTDFQEATPVLLEFLPLPNAPQPYSQRSFLTAIDEINSNPHGQKIAIITGADPHRLSITAINYVQTRERVGEIFTEVVYPREEFSPPFNYLPQPTKGSQQEEESFFSRYKWPLIIGGVLLYTMSTAAPEQPQQGAAPRS